MRNSFLFLLSIVFVSCSKNNDLQLSNWEVLNTNTSQTIFDIDFSDNNNGLALISIGSCIITNDGGESWIEKQIVSNENLVSCFELNKNEIFVGRNRFFKTSDGGLNFNEYGQGEIDYASSIKSIHFFDSSTGIVLKAGRIYKTYDGGQSWVEKYSQSTYSDFIEYSDNTLYVAGGITYDGNSFGELHKSENQGETWAEINLPMEIQNWQINTIDFINSDIGFISTFENKIYKTLDGASSWSLVKDFNGSIYNLAFIDEQIGYLTSGDKIFKTTNGGSTWNMDYQGNIELYYIEKTENSIYVSGRDGIILKNNNPQ
ncbi:WD40/YVTN/BNR-like repeat-containing protein [Echinicola salinicaeni]|uniref:WD40/YVTN/BNR-like repeat-containing protein n=1 Tax=Echinicola salinicaeni TaxID=2762757 RepID=UPI0016455083|nr:YCF48-related protein [Echinicola salinicaeni]